MSGRSWICREQIPKDIQGDQHCCALVTIGSLDVGSLLLHVQTNSQIQMVARGRYAAGMLLCWESPKARSEKCSWFPFYSSSSGSKLHFETFLFHCSIVGASLVAQMVKNPSAMQQSQVRSLGQEWQLSLVFLPGEFYGQGSLASTVQRVTKSLTQLSDWHFYF